MSDVSNIGSSVYPVYSYTHNVAVRSVQAPHEPFSPIELSATDRAASIRIRDAVSRGTDLSSLSLARARAIRAEIENGTYETRARIEGTVERLLDVIA